MPPKTLTPGLLRTYHIISYGEDVSKDDISYKVRSTVASEAPDSKGCRTALDLIIKGEVVETHFYDASQEEAVQQFIKELTEDIPTILADARNYIKLVAEAAASSGLLAN